MTTSRTHRHALARTLVLVTSLSGCFTEGEGDDAPALDEAEQGVVGQPAIDSFTTAFNALSAAGVALPTAEQIVDIGTCDLSDPLEPSWTDRFGGRGYRYWDDFKGIYRTYASTRVGDLPSSAATIKLRFTYVGLATNVTGTASPKKITYQKDAAGNSYEDWTPYTVGDVPGGPPDLVRRTQTTCGASWETQTPGCLPSVTASATPAGPTATFTIKVGNKVDWSLPCGGIFMRGAVRLERPVHVGSVKIAAFPVGIIYEPDFPAGDRSFGKGIQEIGATMGTTFTTSVRREDSAQDFSVEANNLTKAKEVLSVLGTVVSKTKVPNASAIGGILSALADGLGTDTTSVFHGRIDDTGASVQSVLTASEENTTNLMPSVTPTGETGLGRGDQLCWLRNVTFGYVWIDGYLRLIPIAYGESRCHPAFRVRNQVSTLRLRADCMYLPPFNRPSYCTAQPGEVPGSLADLEALIALDPFITDPAFRPESDPDRFTGCQAMARVSYRYLWREANTSTMTSSGAVWQSRTITQTPGWLNLFGIGPSVPVNTTLKTTHTTLRQATTGTSIGTGLQIFRNGDAHEFVQCFDTAFSSVLAVRPPPPPASCVGHCGGSAAGDVCWCDAACASYGDCCADKLAVCGP